MWKLPENFSGSLFDLAKNFRMAVQAVQFQNFIICFVNQNQIGLNMAIAIANKIAF